MGLIVETELFSYKTVPTPLHSTQILHGLCLGFEPRPPLQKCCEKSFERQHGKLQ
jgi:hypothetical protein